MQLYTQDINPITGDVQFSPASFGLTMNDIEKTPSLLSVKTSLYAGNFSLTADEYREVVRLSEAKFQAIDTSGIFNGSVLPSIDMTGKDPGLYMTNQYFGFYDGTEWRAYIGNNGDFRFAGSTGDNYIQWNSITDTIEIKGKIVGSEIDGGIITSTGGYGTAILTTGELSFYGSGVYSGFFLTLRPDQLTIHRDDVDKDIVIGPTGMYFYWSDSIGTSIQSAGPIETKYLSIGGPELTGGIILGGSKIYNGSMEELKPYTGPSVGQSSRTTAEGTGAQTITLPFTPSTVLIFAHYAGPETGTSDGVLTSSFQHCRYTFQSNGGYYTGASYETTRVIRVQDWNGNTSRAQGTIVTNGFELNWTSVSVNTNFFYIAYP